MVCAVLNDSRAHPRVETHLAGRLLSLDGRCNYDCTITDVSEGGARVTCWAFGLMPARLFLFVARTSDLFESEVRWRRDGELGLRFIDAVPRSTRKVLIGLAAKPAH
jgi:hypothetical protein